MGQLLPGFPDLPSHAMTVVLDGIEYRVRFTWRARLAAWYFDLWLLDGTALAIGRRVSPGWGPVLGLTLAGVPESRLIVVGPDGYGQSDLGGPLAIIAYSDAEVLELAAADPPGVTVVIT